MNGKSASAKKQPGRMQMAMLTQMQTPTQIRIQVLTHDVGSAASVTEFVPFSREAWENHYEDEDRPKYEEPRPVFGTTRLILPGENKSIDMVVRAVEKSLVQIGFQVQCKMPLIARLSPPFRSTTSFTTTIIAPQRGATADKPSV